ncbi:MAG: amidase [Chloroflexota bacterium]
MTTLKETKLLDSATITEDDIATAATLFGLEYSDAELALMLAGINDLPNRYEELRALPLENALSPALLFDPGESIRLSERPGIYPATSAKPPTGCPDNIEEMAFYTVEQLGHFLHTQQVTSVALTEMYLSRLKTYGPKLECVITLTEELALQQAKRADAEIKEGKIRSPLHGIPWGAKDLLATKGYPTTWGATPFKNQLIDEDAAVVRKLEDAGAVLVAKLTMGALAWGDVWFGGKTRSPWNIKEGSSGSSAGSGSATAAGLVGFAIGTETFGSIVSPSTNCGLSGLRPTFGRVSRAGAMALCWSLDKIGPMCRSVGDCGLVFDAIRGTAQAVDRADPSTVSRSFRWPVEADLSQLRIGYLADDFAGEYEFKEQDAQSLAQLRYLGAKLVPVQLPAFPLEAMLIILWVEAATAFDELTRSGQDDLLVRQVEDAWPNRLRVARQIPAVEYLQANRIRTLVSQAMNGLMSEVDVYIAPSRGQNLLLTNLTGHPTVCIPNGFRENGLPTSISITGQLYDESTVLAAAKALQDATEFHTLRPNLKSN